LSVEFRSEIKRMTAPDFLLERFAIAHEELYTECEFAWEDVRKIHACLILARHERSALPLDVPPGYPADSMHFAVLSIAKDFHGQTWIDSVKLMQMKASPSEHLGMLRDLVEKLPCIDVGALASEMRIEAVVAARLRGGSAGDKPLIRDSISEESAGSGAIAIAPKPQRPPPLKKDSNARRVREILSKLKSREALTGPQIVAAILDTFHVNVDESTLRKNAFPELEPHGLKHIKRRGYWLEPE